MRNKISDPGHKNTDIIRWKLDQYNQRQVDVDATLKEMGLTRAHIMNTQWASNSVEFRLKQSMLRSKRGATG